MKSVVNKKLQNGKYILSQELGEGGFGRTYQAVNQILDRAVVIKTFKSLPSKESQIASLRKQFLHEAQRLVQCYHPNIVRFYEFFIEDEVPYIVMDYIEGQTLHKIIYPNNPLPEATAIKYIRQIGEALKVVHNQGLLHRDIKPQNLILRQDKQEVILIDFGIAREFNQGMIQTHTNVVSDGYAPIEQYLPKAERTPASDVYGLAATLYTLVTAQIPLSATLRNRIALDTPKDIRPELSEQISTAIMQGIALEPEERPHSVEAWLSLLPPANNECEIQSESTKTVCLIGTDNDSAQDTPMTGVTKPSYLNKIVQGLILFAGIVWGLDYVWLRWQTSPQKEIIPLNSVEKAPVIPIEKSEQVNTESNIQPNTSPLFNPANTQSSPTEITPKPIIQKSIPTQTPTPKFISSPQKTTTQPIRKSTPSQKAITRPIRKSVPQRLRTNNTPKRKVTPARTTRPKSNRVPSVFVAPTRKVTPPRTTRPKSNRVPSVFVSPERR